MKAILSCACGAVPDYCKRSFKIMFPDERPPVVYIKTKARPLLEDIPKESPMAKRIEKILHDRGRYGYYFEYNEEGEILDEINLLKHKRRQ